MTKGQRTDGCCVLTAIAFKQLLQFEKRKKLHPNHGFSFHSMIVSYGNIRSIELCRVAQKSVSFIKSRRCDGNFKLSLLNDFKTKIKNNQIE